MLVLPLSGVRFKLWLPRSSLANFSGPIPRANLAIAFWIVSHLKGSTDLDFRFVFRLIPRSTFILYPRQFSHSPDSYFFPESHIDEAFCPPHCVLYGPFGAVTQCVASIPFHSEFHIGLKVRRRSPQTSEWVLPQA